jgi:peptide deformylase
MTLEIVKYGHPALRERGQRVAKVTAEIRQLAEDMLETMYAAKGVGLAAPQVGRALQLTVLDVREVTDRPSTMLIGGAEVDVAAQMPLVLLNPEITPTGPSVTGPEGCLSFPEMYADITRPESVRVKGERLKGDTIEFDCGGLLAKAIQHEADHLQGILFIDRMTRASKEELKTELDALQQKTRAALAKKK